MKNICRCVVIEDQVMFLQLLVAMLQAKPGLQIVGTATNVAEALKLCTSMTIDLMILDLSLPDGDGLAVARCLMQYQPKAHVMVLSGQANSFLVPPDLSSQVLAVVDKTAAFQSLQIALDELLGDPVQALTPRQFHIFKLIGQGLHNKEIAKTLELATSTVETHRKAIAHKLQMSGAELVRLAALYSR
jgi:DNA-binding NarL/FixJ family response regulator